MIEKGRVTRRHGCLVLFAAVTAASAALAATAPAASALPPDSRPRSGDQWYIDVLKIRQAHLTTRGEGVVVAVVDGGVDASHPELAGQVLPGNGFGIDAAPDGSRDDDSYGHGTSMAGIIAARESSPPDPIVGIAPAAKILPVSTGAEADTSEVARAVQWAADHGADVINLSLGSPGPAFRMETRAIEYALERDVVIVAAAGNEGPDDQEINSPANIPGVIAVTGSTAQGDAWSGSVEGPEAAVAAPAPGIRAPVPTRVSSDGLDTGSGTSNSAAVVSGVVALLRSHFPDLDAANIINRLLRTAVDAGPPGRDDRFGFGIVDPVAALTANVTPVTVNPLLAPAYGADARTAPQALADAFAAIGGNGPSAGPVPGGGQPTPTEPAPVTAPPGDGDAAARHGRSWGDVLTGLGIAVGAGIGLGFAVHRAVARVLARRRPQRRDTAPGNPAGSDPGSHPGSDPGDEGTRTPPAAPPASPPPPTEAFPQPSGIDGRRQGNHGQDAEAGRDGESGVTASEGRPADP